MIRSFRCEETEKIFKRLRSRRFPSQIQQRAFAKLNQINAATKIEDLRFPPSNRLELRKDDRAGEWSIRINDQWRICFRWAGSDAESVAIVDSH